ncbi:MAG TPA: PLP-dependent aminotransferase family protein, partial [Cytophagaceae bacterium]
MLQTIPRTQYADRMHHIPISFIREILKVASQPGVISFAGGLPNPDFFPAEELNEAAQEVLGSSDKSALQYTITEGLLPLREYIAQQYLINNGLKIDPSEILITNGSQQGLDIIAKILINSGDKILMEDPTYLGAIQSFSAYQPHFITAPLEHDGIDLEMLEQSVANHSVKMFYTVPNFQNPSGTTYSLEKRKAVAEKAMEYNFIIVEDDP